MILKTIMKTLTTLLLTVAVAGLAAGGARAQEKTATINISIKDHKFQPAEVKAPANKPLLLRVKNLDATAMEFESVTLRVEKVVAAKSEGTIRVRPLAPGRYKFIDDFNQSATGELVVE